MPDNKLEPWGEQEAKDFQRAVKARIALSDVRRLLGDGPDVIIPTGIPGIVIFAEGTGRQVRI